MDKPDLQLIKNEEINSKLNQPQQAEMPFAIVDGESITELPSDSVVPTAADAHDEIAIDNGVIGVGGSVHPHHAERELVRFGEAAFAQQRRDDRRLELLDKLADNVVRL